MLSLGPYFIFKVDFFEINIDILASRSLIQNRKFWLQWLDEQYFRL